MMLGVVVWTNEADHSAVIWCEDQGPVAYLTGKDRIRGASWPAEGDVVTVEVLTAAGVRRALAVDVIGAGQGSLLTSGLRKIALAVGAAGQTVAGVSGEGTAPRAAARRPALRLASGG